MKSFFKKIGRKQKNEGKISSSPNVITAPLSASQLLPTITVNESFSPSQLVVGSSQSVGKHRDHNEDSIVTFSITIGNGTNNQPLGLFIVADGMGGYQYGEVASNVAARTVASYLIKKFHPVIADATVTLDESLQEIMNNAVKEAQLAVVKSAPGSGTTLTAVLVHGQQMTIAHVGDSRAYSIQPNGKVEPLTRDHTLVRRLEELGQITSDEAAVHPQRNVLYRALGQDDFLEADIFTTPFPQPGYLFICSDGLWGVVSDAEISQIISESINIQAACQSLVAAANAAGGPDNISAILVNLLS
ncbi:MAG: protein phosphatase 2C domain-containing protein [Chloroflexota bacterium]